jgi:membrane protein YdbS with pleckstrin-like domain
MQPTEVRLRPPRNLVDRRALAYWAVRALAGWLGVFALEIIWRIYDNADADVLTVVMLVTAVIAIAHIAVMPRWRYRVHRWEATPEAVYTQSGWLNQERRIAPISRIQTVDSEQGPIEQLFGLANVTVTTASAAGPLKINGLDRETARRLADDLTDGTRADQSDAT